MTTRGIARFVTFTVGSALYALQAQPARLAPSGSGVTFPVALENKRSPVWGGNALVVAEGSVGEPDLFQAYDLQGALVFNARFSIPGALRTFVRSYARGSDGTLALSGSAYGNGGGGAPFIAWITPDGNSQQVVRTEPYTPNLIAVAPDGTFWTVGRELNSNSSEKSGVNLDAGVVRRFSRSGQQIGSWLPRSSFSDPSELAATSGYLAASADRIGWMHYQTYLHPGGVGGYEEILFDGTLTHYPLPQIAQPKRVLSVEGMTINDSGDVFAVIRDSGAPHSGFSIVCLIRSTKQWNPVPLSWPVEGDFAFLYGAHGSDLVLQMPGDSPSQIHFLTPVK
jgi:hypothetical protein